MTVTTPLLFSIPVLVCIYLLLRHRKETTSWEYLLMFLPSIIGFYIYKNYGGEQNILDTRWINIEAVSVRDYSTGLKDTNCNTCKRPTHRYKDYYTVKLSNGKEVEIQESLFERYKNYWGNEKTKKVRVENDSVHMTEYYWNKDIRNCLVVTFPEVYQNYLQNSRCLYDLGKKISDVEAETIGLYKYSPIGFIHKKNHYWKAVQKTVYGLEFSVPDSTYALFEFLATFPNFRPIVLLYKNGEPAGIAEKQRSYWNGGNSNEAVFCVGIDSLHNIKWSSSFSWSRYPIFEENVLKNSLKVGKKLELEEVANDFRENYINGNWMPRNFQYYGSVLGIGTLDHLILVIAVIILNFVLMSWVIQNKYLRKIKDEAEKEEPKV